MCDEPLYASASLLVLVCVYLGDVPEVEEVVYLGWSRQEAGYNGVIEL